MAGQNGEGEAHIDSLPVAKTRPAHSERLVRQLTAHKVGIIAADLASKPDIALAVLVAQLARQVLGDGYFSLGGYGLGIRLNYEDLNGHAPDYLSGKAAQAMQDMRSHWLDQLPLDEEGPLSEDVLTWTLAQDSTTLLELLAFLVAGTVQGVTHYETSKPTDLDRLGSVTGVDLTQWWTPTAESYFSHVNKDQIAAVVTETHGAEEALSIAKMKKAQAVEHAQQLLADKAWLPVPLRIQSEPSQ